MKPFLPAMLLAPLLTLSATALAQQAAGGWIADPQSGCKVWNQEPEPEDRISWQGPCKDGYAEGRGTLRWFSKAENYETDDGEYRGGKLNGAAVMTFKDGARFEGSFVDQLPHGQGTWRRADGAVHTGVWNKGCLMSGGQWVSYSGSAEACAAK